MPRSRPKSSKPSKPVRVDKQQTEPIKLEDLIPQEASFVLNETTYNLNKITLEDQVWLSDTYGEKLEEILQNLPLKEVCEIVFHLMPFEQQCDFEFKVVEAMNGKGQRVKKELTGPMQLRALISGVAQQIIIVKALLQTIGISQPVIDKLEQETIKKNVKTEETLKMNLQ